jgi:hypothetical protein
MAEARAAGKAELMNMENGKSKDSPVVCQNNQGFEIRAGLFQLDSRNGTLFKTSQQGQQCPG